jgi:hypothetical protein
MQAGARFTQICIAAAAIALVSIPWITAQLDG